MQNYSRCDPGGGRLDVKKLARFSVGRVLLGYRLSISPGVQFHDPALYRGTAGIGYGLLRLCHPELLPSFLSWE